MIPYQYIAIEGNIGSGKTTLTSLLTKTLSARQLEESFEDNPFLPIFYQDPERYAFPVELHFMAERHKQLSEIFSAIDLFNPITIADYSPQKSLLFAMNSLNIKEFRLFKTLYDALFRQIRKPDLIIYLHRDIPELMRNIRKRGRAYELNIQKDYLLNVHKIYQEMFRMETEIPILWMYVDGVDFLNSAEDYQFIVDKLAESFKGGIHYFDLSS
jgi:deoxyguanosine kinase